MGMMLHRHLGVDEQSAPNVIKTETSFGKHDTADSTEDNAKYYAEKSEDTVKRGRKRKDQ